ncbi:sensor histidine kinase [Streptomyces sp. NPDC056452]|uniref:sensor histidine kinase n=1 Tax=Streptomyces sp. NPDC056452 TaxID=3345821 RepID=UPI0036D0CCC5
MKSTLVGSVLLWAALNVPAVALVPGSGLDGSRRWETLFGAVAVGIAVAVRRTRPLVSLALCAGLWWTLALLLDDVDSVAVMASLPAVCVMSYAVGRLPVDRRAALRVLGPVGVAAVVGGVRSGLTVPMWAVLASGLIFAGLLPWLLGRYTRQRDELQVAGWEHARQLELQQRSRVEQARMRERARIAEDMHDSLGHELNLIALRAGALQMAPDLGDHHRETAAGLRAGAAEAMERLRDIIGVLREDGAPAPLEPSHAGVGVLVDRARASGAGVELRCTGQAGELPGMTDKAVYRVVQESLTNVMKHAPGSAVTVRLDHTPLDVTVAVRNGPPVRDPLESRAQGGRGLIGLQERTRLAGGEFRAGVLPDGGFEVTARLPRVPGRAGVGAGADGAAVGVPEAIPAGALPAGAGPAGVPPVGSGQGAAFGGLMRATAGLRRRFVVAVGLPLGLFACLAAAMLGYYAYGAASSVLQPSAYAQLEIGAPAGAVGRLLPSREMSDAPSEHRPEPSGATCSYYRASGELFVAVDVYRLCFAHDRLVDKTELTAESRLQADHG